MHYSGPYILRPHVQAEKYGHTQNVVLKCRDVCYIKNILGICHWWAVLKWKVSLIVGTTVPVTNKAGHAGHLTICFLF